MVEVEIVRNGDIIKILDEASVKSTLALAINGAAQAKALAPVDDGVLKNSIMWKSKSRKGGFNDSDGESAPYQISPDFVTEKGQTEAYVGFNLKYGIYQEFGTRNMKPQPFLRPSLALIRGADSAKIIKKIQEEELRGKLRKGQSRETFGL